MMKKNIVAEARSKATNSLNFEVNIGERLGEILQVWILLVPKKILKVIHRELSQ